MSEIKTKENKNIDTVLWDRCVSRSQNGDVFGYSWFLDSVYEKWQGVVKGNYQAVMPLPVNAFLGLKFVKNYKFLNKIDIYSHKEISENDKRIFLETAKSFSKFITINSENTTLANLSEKVKTFYSFKLDLIRPYKDIRHAEKDFIIKQINSSESNKIFYNTGILPNGITLLSTLTKSLNRKNIDTLRRLSAVSMRRNLGQIYGAFNDRNRLIAAVLFISSHYKVNIIHTVQTREAENKKALTLDFFGLNDFSEEFFKEIGAVKYPWYKIKL